MLKPATTPSKVFRISKGNPWQILPPRFQNRFDISVTDEPTATLYTGESAEAAVAEIMAPLRPDLETIANVNSIPADDNEPASGMVSRSWLSSRTRGEAQVKAATTIVDISDPETINSIRNVSEIAKKALECGFSDVDESSLKASGTNGRRFTQTVAAYIYGEYFSGIRYTSRLGANYHCIAAFIPLNLKTITDSDFFEEILKSAPLKTDDKCVQEVVKIFNLSFCK